MPRDRTGIGAIDYTLMGFGSALAVYSGAMSLNEPDIAWYFVRLVAVGTLVSFGIRRAASRSKFLWLDGVLYTLALVAAFAFANTFNNLTPDPHFPPELMPASWLCWMLSLGSFLTWRDGTLLFQAIPAMALFGLVGCYDTFRDVTFAFFGFLICLATLFARAHGREMLRQAAESGYFHRGELPGRVGTELEANDALMAKIKEGPWRWVAGPEWALASALGIVLLSLLGAPVIQESVGGIVGQFHMPMPHLRGHRQGLTNSIPEDFVTIGNGPNTNLTSAQLYAVRMDQPRYLRTGVFDLYTGRGWRQSPDMTAFSEPNPVAYAIEQMKDAKPIAFEIDPLSSTRLLPTPGEVVSWADGQSPVRERTGGTWESQKTVGGDVYAGTAVVASPTLTPRDVATDLPISMREMTDTDNFNADVVALAREVTQGAQSDYEKAEKIRDAIASRVRYNLKAPRTPTDEDPVQYFLFDSKEGYCDLFASAMVQMARAAGLPARYVQGYLPDGDHRDSLGRYMVLDRDYHAWAEVFFKDAGWVVFDATAGAAQAPGGERDTAPNENAWYQAPWVQTALNVTMGAAVLVGLVGVALTLRNQKAKDPRRAELDRAYTVFARMLERRVGHRREVAQTADELLTAALPSLNGSAEAARSLNRKFVRAMYSEKPLDTETVAEIRADLRHFREMLKKDRSHE